MGTNFFFRFDECDTCTRYTEIHVCKSRYTWRAYRHDRGDRLSPLGFPVESLADWRTVFTTVPGKLFDEYGRYVDDPLAWLDEASPWRPTPDGAEDLARDLRDGSGWLDAKGFRFYAEEFS